MVIKTCSFILNGPGFNVISHLVPLKNTRSVMVRAMRCPRGTTAICADIEVIERGSLRYQKNWLRNESRIHDKVPRTHIRNVRTGSVGSSVIGTVNATCLIGEFWVTVEFSDDEASSAMDDDDDDGEPFFSGGTA
eukprot:TRINITY_DN2332_c0_g1_i2.p2 TRINITY_DN2332_c0_g1~~TRINITY_DN2332_c0_g1_i2.p2  ORF type:complete len:135 (+),score=11.69 TRINITY_DN2332_c0_g1_i2:409-813(+)